MVLNILRAIFILVILAVLFVNLNSIVSLEQIQQVQRSTSFWTVTFCGLGLAVFVFLIDILTPKKRLGALAGVFFGLLIGILVSWALTPIVDMLGETLEFSITDPVTKDTYKVPIIAEAITAIKWMLSICICYLVISIVIRTKDDVRFVIPYVEFTKQTKGARPLVLDTSVIIDGRIADLSQSKLFDAPLIVPRFVLNELQLVADSADRLKRNRGRRGLDMLNKMQSNTLIDINIDDTIVPDVAEVSGVDEKLVIYSKNCNGRLVTNDYNLNKVAQLHEVDVVNINDMANSLKAIVLPGEVMEVKIVKPGEEEQQGVGYLEDGTMVVVSDARDKLGQTILINVTSSLQTSAGKMVFGKFERFTKNDKS